MRVIVYGSNCVSCKKMHQSIVEINDSNNLNLDLVYENDLNKIIDKGIMMTPALEIDGKIVSMGKMLKVKDLEALLIK